MAESKRDYYEVLGIGKDADEAAIKKAYRVLAKKYHPDMNPGDAEAEKKFKEASEAYAVLSDPEKRQKYDQFGHAALDLILKDPCETCNGTGAKPGTSPETCPKCGGRGQVVYTSQSFFGTVQNVQTCPNCGGSGKVIKEKCSKCAGSGYIANRKKIKVSIPAGIDNGQSVRIRDKGEPGVNGGPRGDLLVEVNVSAHPSLKRQDIHIFSTHPISFAVAALGGDIRIPTVDGDVIYNVKPGTKTDTKVRLKGKGVPSLRNPQARGDHYVTLEIQTPERLSSEAKEALRRFDELTGNTLHEHDETTGKVEKKKKKGFMEKMKEMKEALED